MPEAFAVVREAGRRVLNMRHFDVQLIGGMVLHNGKIAEMKTGEGKTLVATLPAYLNALEGKGVHVVTVNDYLARRDSEWMGPPVPLPRDERRRHPARSQRSAAAGRLRLRHHLRHQQRVRLRLPARQHEVRVESMVQRGHHFAIVDEVDSILIDEARTPLIISGPAEESTDLYYEVDRIIPRLKKGAVTQGNVKAEDREQLETTGDYIVDEKHKTVTLTETGMAKAEQMLAHRLVPESNGLYDPANMPLLHHVHQALRAHTLFRLDVDYMIKDGEVVIVDEFTGRLMPGRRWSDGLHQAVEAKEKVKIERENQTLATITFQNYFRKYKKLSGMTGTAETEAPEFDKIYNLDVIVAPTNRVLRRIEEPDLVYRTEREKYDAIVNDILEKQEAGRPTLVGTVSIEKSSDSRPSCKQTRHQARRAEREVPRAGGRDRRAGGTQGQRDDRHEHGGPRHRHPAWRQPRAHGAAAVPGRRSRARSCPRAKRSSSTTRSSSTSSTSMGSIACPGADWERIFTHFKSQSPTEHEEVVNLGGLHILGTERHEARRIDNQLRGRAGRQGDPGSSRFYLSLEDDLMRIFGSDRIASLMQRLGMEEGVPIEHGMVSRAIERAQKQVEAQNFSVRKHLLEYDDVMNKQRESVYTLRREILEGNRSISPKRRSSTLAPTCWRLARRLLEDMIDRFAGKQLDFEEWDIPAIDSRRPHGCSASTRRNSSRWISTSKSSDEIGRRAAGHWPRTSYDAKEHRRGRSAATRRARHHAADRRCAVERPPLLARSPQGRHRTARLRPARSARRVQEGKLRPVPRHEGTDRRRDGAVSVLASSCLIEEREDEVEPPTAFERRGRRHADPPLPL